MDRAAVGRTEHRNSSQRFLGAVLRLRGFVAGFSAFGSDRAAVIVVGAEGRHMTYKQPSGMGQN
jgi:hypothetical protein